jgi:hypothetical protein
MKKIKKNITKDKLREFLFFGLTSIMIIISLWFISSNSVFIIKKINSAFNPEIEEDGNEIIEFDKEGFQKLNLLKEK